MTETAPATPTTAVALRDEQTEFDDKQIAALSQLGVSGASRADLAVFFHQCRRTGLDPFIRQIYMISRRTKVDGQWVHKQTQMTGIDGYRVVARRAARAEHESLEYEDTMWCGPDGVWTDVWLDPEHPPVAAKVGVVRGGKPFRAVALFREYAATKPKYVDNKKTDDVELTGQWVGKPAVMIAKCAEALALRKAYPQDLSGLYTEDEMAQVDLERLDTPPTDTPAPSAAASRLRDAAAREQAAADPTPEPDPAPEPAAEQRPDNVDENGVIDAEVVDENGPAEPSQQPQDAPAAPAAPEQAQTPARADVAPSKVREALAAVAAEHYGDLQWEAEVLTQYEDEHAIDGEPPIVRWQQIPTEVLRRLVVPASDETR